ncbi:RhaT Permeases of the drug/metabolite transporter (DMT) superfamily [Rhabdaerophilaceae bacterium]
MTFSSRQLATLAMLGAVAIYGTNFAVSRHGILYGLTPNDLTALRFGVASVLLAPLFLRAGGFADCAGIGWGRALILTLTSGLPMTLLMMQGIALSPAAHGASIAPGTVTVVGVIGGLLLFGVKPSRNTLIGIAVVLAGLTTITVAAGSSDSRNILLGDLCFLGVGLIWGSYPLLLQRWKVDALRACAVMAILSALVFLPWYGLEGFANLAKLPLSVVAFHAVNQGILNMVVGLWLWGYAVKLIGAASAGQFPPLIPVIGTLTAIPLLGEWPGPMQWIGVALIIGGLVVAAQK